MESLSDKLYALTVEDKNEETEKPVSKFIGETFLIFYSLFIFPLLELVWFTMSGCRPTRNDLAIILSAPRGLVISGKL